MGLIRRQFKSSTPKVVDIDTSLTLNVCSHYVPELGRWRADRPRLTGLYFGGGAVTGWRPDRPPIDHCLPGGISRPSQSQ